MTGVNQPLKNLKQHRDVIEVQTGRRLIENEEISSRAVTVGFVFGASSLRQM
jgi:hypothetical protein